MITFMLGFVLGFGLPLVICLGAAWITQKEVQKRFDKDPK